MGMILTGHAILEAISAGHIIIDPFNRDQVNPASYDLTLGDTVRVYKSWTHDCNEPGRPQDGMRIYERDITIDVHQPAETVTYQISKDTGWVIKPGIGYLMHTAERVYTDHYVPVIDGKSSMGRLFVQVHETAGYCDPGFDGQITLEVTARHPVRVYPGMRFCQIRFHVPKGKIMLYSGHYTGEKAFGPVGSEIHDLFRMPATGRSA